MLRGCEGCRSTGGAFGDDAFRRIGQGSSARHLAAANLGDARKVSLDAKALDRAEHFGQRQQEHIPGRAEQPHRVELRPHRQQHAAGTVLGGVCIGSIMLARSGLLDGRSATTHWSSAKSFAARYPAVRLEADKPIVDDGDLITTAGLMAWSELGLRLVDRLMGPSIAADTARFLVIEHSDSASQCGSNFAPILSHGDAAILKVQHGLQASGAVDVSVASMAQEAGLEERTFLRRFRNATGLKPTEYCQHLRVGKARQMLEFTNGTIDHIAWTVGYQDPSAFRAIFKKITGLAPSDYRSRFGV